jgi:glycosyltransferase involved in cell wall biosynthesis
LRFIFTTTFYPPYHLGGDAVHVKYLADELARLGHEVHVLHSIDAYQLKRKSAPKEEIDNKVHLYPIHTPFNLSAYTAYFSGKSRSTTRKFRAIVEEIEPDVVHHHNISLLGYDILKKQGQYSNLYTAHDYWLICQENNLLKNGKEICVSNSCFSCSLRQLKPPQIWRKRREFANAIANVDFLISPSNYVKNKIFEKVSINGITLSNFVPRPQVEITSSGFSDFFLYAGVLEKHKGILDLLELFRNTKISSKLLIAGNGSLRSHIAEYVRKNCLENRIIFLGWVEGSMLTRLLSDATALVMPSKWEENNPLIALEALSVGTPVIGSNKGGLPEIINKVDTKLVFNQLNELKGLLQGFSRKGFSSKKIKSVYEENFSPEVYVHKYINAIKKM